MSSEEEKSAVKEATKQAIKEFLQEKYAEIGKWSVRLIIGGALGLLVYLILLSQGWTPPKH